MVTKKRTEAETPPEVFAKLVRSADARAVLVGGQALAFWVGRYDLVLPQQFTTVSSDTDWLVRSPADKDAVERFARTIRGRAWFPSEHALTALVGQAVFDLSDDEFINVDILFKVLGIDAAVVRQRAVEARHEGASLPLLQRARARARPRSDGAAATRRTQRGLNLRTRSARATRAAATPAPARP